MMNRNTLSYAGLACLLLYFCFRLWNLGITHHDDAIWLLASYQGRWSVIHDFAVNQGRIWAYVSGALMYIALSLDGSIAGGLLRVGSFAVFFVLFYFVASIYLGRRIALMAAVLNLSLYAMRWEGSIVNTYPAFSWILSSLFLCAVWLGWRFANTSRLFFLYSALATFFVSLFLHEGVSVLFSMLFMLSIFSNHYFVQGTLPFLASMLNTETSRRHLVGAAATVVLYFSLYFIWRSIFNTNYEGNTLSGASILRAFPTLFGLSTSGSLLSDIVHPYAVNFADAVGQDGYSVSYSVLSYIRAATDGPSALLSALIVFSVVYLLASSDNPSQRASNFGWFAIGGIVVGILIAFVPILPVALVAKYQRHYAELRVHSYVYTALSHFGVTLGLSSLLLWVGSLTHTGTLKRNIFSTFIAIIVSVLAYCGYQMNDAIANDIRIETSRWKVVDQTMEIVSKLERPITAIYAPRLFSGSWFSVMDGNYWSQYVLTRHGKIMTFVRDPIKVSTIEGNAAFVDFTMGRNPSQSVVVLAPLGVSGRDDSVVVNRIVVAIERPDPSDLAQYVLSFRDAGQQRSSTEVRFSHLEPIGKSETVRSLSNINALPASIRVVRNSTLKSIPVRCGKSILSGTTIFFGTAVSGEGRVCIDDEWLKDGWNSREQAGVWSRSRNAVIDLSTNGLSQGTLVLTISVGTYTGLGFNDTPQTVTVRNGSHDLATRTDKKGVGFQPMQIKFPRNTWKAGGSINLSIDTDHTINPANEKLSSDTRDLGVYIQSIKVDVVKDVT